MFGRATIRLGIGPHSSNSNDLSQHVSAAYRRLWCGVVSHSHTLRRRTSKLLSKRVWWMYMSFDCKQKVASARHYYLSNPVYTIQPVVKPVVQPVWFDKHGLTTGWTNSCSFNTVVKPGCTTGLTNGCIVYTNIYLVAKPDWQQVVSCKRAFSISMFLRDDPDVIKLPGLAQLLSDSIVRWLF